MKKLVLIILCCVSLQLNAQTWDEFFNQKKTQKEYLLKQIVALQLYGGYLKKGYEIAKGGLKTINDLKDGEFNLHHDFFNSLKSINPIVSKDPNILEILSWNKAISKGYADLKTNNLTDQEVEYIQAVKNKLKEECNQDLIALKEVLTPNELEMKDNERLSRISKIHQNIQEKFQFTQAFIADVIFLQKQKEQERRDTENAKTWFNLSN